MGLKTKVALGILAILTATNVNYVVQRQQAIAALEETSRLTVESVALDKKSFDKARYEAILPSLDDALKEVADLKTASIFGQPAALIDNIRAELATPWGRTVRSFIPDWFRADAKQFVIKDPTGPSVYIYIPFSGSSPNNWEKDILKSTKNDFEEKIRGMKWDVEYLPPTREEILNNLGIEGTPQEAISESLKPEYNQPAFNSAGKIANYENRSGMQRDYSDLESIVKINKVIDAAGEAEFKKRFGFSDQILSSLRRGGMVVSFGPLVFDSSVISELADEYRISVKPEEVAAFAIVLDSRPVTEAELIRRSAYFLPYLNKPIPYEVTPEPIPIDKFQFAPVLVDADCLEQKVREFQGKEGIVIAPKVTDGNLYGFAVTTKVVGGGYSGMNEEILELGRHCEVAAK